ncbi:sigma-70 family RNA polymerase sigma factor [Streptomyces sp. NPDC052016]|uniref:sigma-70 family RNA polymerase sigma factor n=1 Tax=Streptomyces sp. NPDC052016 TaxID=3365680 RepID=UPI0037D7E6B1
MSVDGRGASRGDGDTEAGDRPAPQVPSQGGRGGHARLRRGGDAALDPPEENVPAQRGWHEDSVLPPLRDAPPADAELIGRMRSGDDTAYEELYRRHADAVRRYARTCCRDAHTADDLTAEVFARMLQAVRGGSGPEHAVRAYLLTSVRRVAAGWTRSAKREQLVDDFAVFAAQAGRSSGTPDGDPLDLGADVRAMHEAEQSLAMRAFRSLPERWQAVLWHTEIEDESPSEVATLFGLDANGTRVLASRAREGLKQAYLQAHVSDTLTSDAECARYADQLGTYARRRLRSRAERGVRKHLEECARCRLAALQIEEVAGGIPAVVPVAVIGWFGAAGYAKAAALIAGGAGAGAAGAAGAGTVAGGGASGGAGAASGGAASAGAASAGASGGASGGGAAASEGLGAAVKAGVAAGVVAVAATVVALALVGDDSPARQSVAEPRGSAPAVLPEAPAPAPEPSRAPGEPEPRPPVIVPAAAATPTPTPSTSPAGEAVVTASSTAAPTPATTPPPDAAPTPTASPTPTPAPTVYQLGELSFDVGGDGTGPEIRLGGSSWVWQRTQLSVAGQEYARGVTVHGESTLTVDLNRACASYDAVVGVDDLTLKLGKVTFSVYADGDRLWTSQGIKGGDPAVPVHVDLAGRTTVRLVVEPHNHLDTVALADWAEARFTCF